MSTKSSTSQIERIPPPDPDAGTRRHGDAEQELSPRLRVSVSGRVAVRAAPEMSERFVRFVEDLAEVELTTNAFNQYSRKGSAAKANAIRRRNLRLYFHQLWERHPTIMLVGEAPSYRGGRLTGVPFVSESILLGGVEPIGMFGSKRGYRRTGEFERISTEASATIVWATIATVDPLPLLWNAFPFHPYREGNQRSNRMPGKKELLVGQPFLPRLQKMFSIEKVIAVGNQAGQSLTQLGIEHARVRHPSQGGKRKFVEGLLALL